MIELTGVDMNGAGIKMSSVLHPHQPYVTVPSSQERDVGGDLRLVIPQERIVRYEIQNDDGKQFPHKSMLVVIIIPDKERKSVEMSLTIGFMGRQHQNILEGVAQVLNTELQQIRKPN